MPVPVPPVALENVCAVIYENALYAYSPTGFLRLDMEPGAEWEELAPGVSVSGGVCVGSTPSDASQAALYVVGGVGPDDGYAGLQKFTYSTKKWESISPISDVMKNRQGHGATYLKSSDSILVYAGSADGVQGLSSETFTIQVQSPFDVISHPSSAPPVISPLLLPWDDANAIMVGGHLENRRVMLFNPDSAWRDSGATLADPIPKDASAIKAVIIKGDDDSRSLYTFDMTQSPNLVRRNVLMTGTGSWSVDSASIVARDPDSLAARQSTSDSVIKSLTLDDWPTYNGTLVPKVTRNNYAAASDESGVVVFAGGNPDDVLSMFDARGNAWMDASLAFAEQERLTVQSVSSTVTSSSSATSTATPTPEVAAGSSDDDEGFALGSNAILGIVLGSIVGLMLLLGLALFLVRRKKRKNQRAAGSDGDSSIEKGGPGMAPRAPVDGAGSGGHFAEDSGASKRGYFQGHYPQHSTDSYSSMAILMGKVNQQNRNLDRKPSTGTNRSSTSSFFNKEFKSTISKPIPQHDQYAPPPMLSDKGMEAGDRITVFGPSLTQNIAPPRPPRGSATLIAPPLRPNANLADSSERRSSGWNRYWSGGSALNILGFGSGKRGTVNSDRSSRYSNNNNNNNSNKMNRVTQDSATVPPLHIEPFEFRAELNRVNSGSPTVAHHPAIIPMKEGMKGKIERPVSQASSGYSSGIPESIHDAWDPSEMQKAWGSDRAPASAYGGQSSAFDPSSTGGPVPIGVSQQPPLATAKTSSDMSWLNLGANARK